MLSAYTQRSLKQYSLSNLQGQIAAARQQLGFEQQGLLDFVVDNHKLVHDTTQGAAQYAQKLQLQQQMLC